MRTSEWIAVGYYLYLFAGALMARLAPGARRRILLAASAVATLIFSLAAAPEGPALRVVRDWLPGAYLIGGYWLSGFFFVRPSRRAEQWCLALDAVIFGRMSLARAVERAPRLALEYLEAAYLVVYLTVPGACLLLVLLGFEPWVDHFWTVVSLAGYGAYGSLVFLQTRPPRSLPAAFAPVRREPSLRRLNLAVLDRGSVHVNTLPSGHSATALAAALVLLQLVPWAGLALLALAFSIAVASVIGRYHYTIDTVSGLVLGYLVWTLF